jgi:hypothetical protein
MVIGPFEARNDHSHDRDAVFGLRQINGDHLPHPDQSKPIEKPADFSLSGLKSLVRHAKETARTVRSCQ